MCCKFSLGSNSLLALPACTRANPCLPFLHLPLRCGSRRYEMERRSSDLRSVIRTGGDMLWPLAVARRSGCMGVEGEQP